MKTAIIVSASSDIGTALAQDWLAKGMRVCGTYRTHSPNVSELQLKGASLLHGDLGRKDSIAGACAALRKLAPQWDALVLCPGVQDPIGPFADTEFDRWEESIAVNFTGQLRVIRELLSNRRLNGEREPTVLLFAGGGPNKATVNYSAYSVSKVALIKMCELLDAELPDTKFVIVNPGWVKTKGHENMLKAGSMAGEDYRRTMEKLSSGDWTPMAKVIECCNWAIDAPRAAVGGRYFGVAFDDWGSARLDARLAQDPNLCKLRRRECLPSEHH